MPERASEPVEATSPTPPALGLSEAERRLLGVLQSRPIGELAAEEGLAEGTGLPLEAVRGALQRLRSKHLAVCEERHLEERHLTERGLLVRSVGLPERRLLTILASSATPVEPTSTALDGLSEEERSAAIGILRRRHLLAPGVPLRLAGAAPPTERFAEEVALDLLEAGRADFDASAYKELARRGLAAADHRTLRRWAASEEGRGAPIVEEAEALGALTPAMLSDGGWRSGRFRPYDVRADVPRRSGARPHPYRVWLDEFEELLVGLGFQEARGPLLESEFWNSDVLFMPQEHPARSIHDVLSVEGLRGRPPPSELLERVAAVHEGRALPGRDRPISIGWRSSYDRAIAARPVLRSQTTSVSARVLATRPSAPFRFYSLGRNFRRDAVDATHHVEFAQCEGIVGEPGVSMRELIGIFSALAEGIGIRELRLRPSYFPFTEPSVEGYVRHPRLGWIEVFPGGILRPEVLAPLGVDVPVAAWGIGVTRLAMVALGISDIRELYEDDLERLRGGVA